MASRSSKRALPRRAADASDATAVERDPLSALRASDQAAAPPPSSPAPASMLLDLAAAMQGATPHDGASSAMQPLPAAAPLFVPLPSHSHAPLPLATATRFPTSAVPLSTSMATGALYPVHPVPLHARPAASASTKVASLFANPAQQQQSAAYPSSYMQQLAMQQQQHAQLHQQQQQQYTLIADTALQHAAPDESQQQSGSRLVAKKPTSPTSVMPLKTSSRRQAKLASASNERSERADRHERSDRSSSAQPIDKHKKRLQRKAELARASRRRKKTYVADLEGKCAQLAAQSGFLLAYINKRPEALAVVCEQKLPSGLVLQGGVLRSTVDLKNKSGDENSDDQDMDDQEQEQDSQNEEDDDQLSDVAPPPPQSAKQFNKQEHSPSHAVRSAVKPTSHTDLAVLAHATEANNAMMTHSLQSHLMPHAFMHTQHGAMALPASILTAPTSAMHEQHQQQQHALLAHQQMSLQQQQMQQQQLQQQQLQQQQQQQHSFGTLPMGMPMYRPPVGTFHEVSAMATAVAAPPTASLVAAPAVHVIKAQYNGDLRRFNMPAADFTFDRLVLTLEQLLLKVPASAVQSSSPPLLLVKYIDDEGDAIEIGSTAELVECLRASQTKEMHSPGGTVQSAAPDSTVLKLLVTDAPPVTIAPMPTVAPVVAAPVAEPAAAPAPTPAPAPVPVPVASPATVSLKRKSDASPLSVEYPSSSCKLDDDVVISKRARTEIITTIPTTMQHAVLV